MSTSYDLRNQAPARVDPRGQRFTAAVNLAGFAVVLLLGDASATAAALVLAALAVGFVVMVLAGPGQGPWGQVFKRLVRPRIGAPQHLEDAASPRFAALVGLVFSVIGLIGYLSGATLLGAVATGFALVAALLNAAFGLCLGCELYLLDRRLFPPTAGRAGSRAVRRDH